MPYLKQLIFSYNILHLSFGCLILIYDFIPDEVLIFCIKHITVAVPVLIDIEYIAGLNKLIGLLLGLIVRDDPFCKVVKSGRSY